jgi:hypothetical protein
LLKPRESRFIVLTVVVIPLLVGFWAYWANRTDDSAKPLTERFSPEAQFQGKVGVTIYEKKFDPGRIFFFVIDLNRGEIHMSPSAASADIQLHPGGEFNGQDCEKMPRIPSPDHSAAAYCTLRGSAYSVAIKDLTARNEGRTWPASKGWAVAGVAWSADSSFAGVLLERERTAFDPIGLLSMISGHPIQMNSYKVVLLAKDVDRTLELPILRKDSVGWARIGFIS